MSFVKFKLNNNYYKLAFARGLARVEFGKSHNFLMSQNSPLAFCYLPISFSLIKIGSAVKACKSNRLGR